MKLYDAFFALARRGAFRWMGDRAFLRLQYRLKRKKPLRLNPPQTYGEKLQWLKLYDRQPVYTQMADKIAARDFVAARVGKKYLIPEIARYSRAEDVDWAALPRRFALKCAHGSSSNILCRDKEALDIPAAQKKSPPGCGATGFGPAANGRIKTFPTASQWRSSWKAEPMCRGIIKFSAFLASQSVSSWISTATPITLAIIMI